MMLSFLVAMIWKSVVIAGSALALAFVVRWRTATDRLILLRAGVAMLLALPLIMAFLPALQIVAFTAPQPLVTGNPLAGGVEFGPVDAASPAPSGSGVAIDPGLVAILVYLAGLALLAVRQLAGLAILHRWTLSAREVRAPAWLEVLDGLGANPRIHNPIRLLVSDQVKSPLSWGWRRPVILIDPVTLDLPQDAEAILVHEVAHVVRRDWPALMLARLAVTVFWFNPLVWLLEREIVQQCEEAADLEAADRVGAAHYAEKLLGWARFGTRLPANSIAASTSALGRRVRNILDGRPTEQQARGWARVATLLCIASATPIAAMQLVAATPEPSKTLPAPSPAVAPVAVPPSAVPDDARAVTVAAVPPTPAVQVPRDTLDRNLDLDSAHVPDVPEIPDVGSIVAGALADMPRIQEEVARTVDQAAIARAMSEAHRAGAWRGRSHAQFDAAMQQVQRSMADVPQIVARSMAGSAAGMESGAAQMEAQADGLERLGKQFQKDRAFREREIERSRRWGRTVTHDDLIEAGKGMQEGARGMRTGAREMHEAAARMRNIRTD